MLPIPATAEEYAAIKREAERITRSLPRPAAPCESCGTPQGRTERGYPVVVLHHADERRPRDVIPVCNRCHVQIHNGTRFEPRTGRLYPYAGDRLFLHWSESAALGPDVREHFRALGAAWTFTRWQRIRLCKRLRRPDRETRAARLLRANRREAA